jgi:hypothetical protein
MSVVQECVLAVQAIQRARSLVSACVAPPEGAVVGGIDYAAESTEATVRLTNHSSGAVISAHTRFVVDTAAALSAAGQSDKTLQRQLVTAAAVTQDGAQRLAAIADRTHATAAVGAGATSAPAQRAVLIELRSQLAQAAEVVESVRQRGAGLAALVQSLQYEPATALNGGDMPRPTGPIVWCFRPRGTFGRYRCSILYPDLRVGTYWSPRDDTGGSLP